MKSTFRCLIFYFLNKFEFFGENHCEGNAASYPSNNELNSRLRGTETGNEITNNSNLGSHLISSNSGNSSSITAGNNATVSNNTINPPLNNNPNPPTMNITRTVTTTESITTPVNQSNSNLNNALIDNNNGNPASPPRYSNNNPLNLLDKGRRIANEGVGIFTDSKSPIRRTITPKSSFESIKSNLSIESNKNVENLEEELKILNNVLLYNEEKEIKELLSVANLEKLSFINKNPEIVLNYENSELETISSLIGDSDSESNSSQSDILELSKDIQINKKTRINVKFIW
jgi:hypothetical protein